MKILGIDGSLRNVGLVVVSPAGEVFAHTTICAGPKLSLVESFDFIYRNVVEFLNGVPIEHKPTHFYMEAMAFGAVGRIAEIGGAHYVVQLAILHWQKSISPNATVKVVCLSSTKIRKGVLGSVPPKTIGGGKTDVKAWIVWRMKALGIATLSTDHENDAVVTALAGAIEEGKRLPCLPIGDLFSGGDLSKPRKKKSSKTSKAAVAG